VREYGLVAIGSGSAMAVVDAWMQRHPGERAALVEKDTPGGICLTRGCIPSKVLLSSADVVRTIERAPEFGVDVRGTTVDFGRVMARMHAQIDPEIASIREGLSHSPNLDFFPVAAEFVAPYTLRAGAETLRAPKILLGLGSEVLVPEVPGLTETGFLTSDSVLGLTRCPARLAILGGGYIAAEYAHFFSAMGATVTVVGRNPRFLPLEDEEVGAVVRRVLGRRVRLLTGRVPERVALGPRGGKVVELPAGPGGPAESIEVDEILVATGRGPLSSVLHPERAGIATDARGWIAVNEFLETSQPGIWALGDATGRFPYKHKANYDAKVLYHALVLGRRTPVDYHAVPHAIFTEPEVAGVGWTEQEARQQVDASGLLVGRYEYRNTAKGAALEEKDGLVKVLVLRDGLRLVGAHVVGPEASVLVQELVTLMYTPTRSVQPIFDGMHIHPALSEVVERAVLALAPAAASPA
jgi:mycothione reductase